MAELETEKAPAGPENASRFGQCAVEASHIPQPEGYGIAIEGSISEWKPFGIAADPFEATQNAAVHGAVAADSQHCQRQVADNHPRSTRGTGCLDAVQYAECDVSGSAGDIDELLTATGMQPINHRPLPKSMNAAGHQIVHQVIPPSHAFEHAAHERRLLFRGDVAKPEGSRIAMGMRGRIGCGHGSQHSVCAVDALRWASVALHQADVVPELPEVETVCRGLAARLEGRRLRRVIQRRLDLRFPLPVRFADRLQGHRIERVDRRAKFILIYLDDDSVILAHLGMTGRMVVGPAPATDFDLHDHVIFETDDGTAVRFNDARRFGFMHLVAAHELHRHPLLSTLGPEPLGDDFNGPVLAAALKGKKRSIKVTLIDQRVVAGIGNIYASESLFHAGVSPRRMARGIQGERAERLAAAIKRVLTEAIAAGGSSLRDFVRTNGEIGYFQHRWAVYEREGQSCPGCDCGAPAAGGVRRIVQGGRSTFYCSKRQR